MPVLTQKYHLPHNAIVVDEFNFMLNSIDLEREYYSYEELRLLFLRKEIECDCLRIFHPKYHSNLLNHGTSEIRSIYQNCIQNQDDYNLEQLLNCQYTPRKTFMQVFNETVRDYTEFFAFMGLLPTYYKGKKGGEKKHFVSQRLREYRQNSISLNQLIFDFKYRNSSKNYDVLDMYQISVRPYVVALKACKHYFDLGFTHVTSKIISAIVLYAKSEDNRHLNDLYNLFPFPSLPIDNYRTLFENDKFDSISKELDRATLQLRPYLLATGLLARDGSFYIRGNRNITEELWTQKVAFCNSSIGSLSVTPVVGKILYKLYSASCQNKKSIEMADLFDNNVLTNDRTFILDELVRLGCIEGYDNLNVRVSTLMHQVSINPYCDFFDINDSNYVSGKQEINYYSEPLFVNNQNLEMARLLDEIRPIALGSNGPLYEKKIFELLRNRFKCFDVTWYGGNATGQRLSDIFVKTKICDNNETKNIVIIIECKAGRAVKNFDERKEIDDIINTLAREKNSGSIDGVWYWVINGDSLPNIDEHGGYRDNNLSLSFSQKLFHIQLNISELMRVPTIVTAFSFDAIKNYISYLYDKIGNRNIDAINRIDVPHFWKWSKKFMNLQYVMVHKNLELGA